MRPTESGRWMRVARSFALTWVAIAVTSGVHVAAGGHVPGLVWTVASTLALSGLLLPFLPGALSQSRATSLLGVLQIAVHVSYALAEHPNASTRASALTVPAAGPHAHHGTGGHSTLSADPQSMLVGTEPMTGLIPSPMMLAGHLGVALLMGWVLARGEQSWRTALSIFATTRIWRLLSGPALAWLSAALGDTADRYAALAALVRTRTDPPLLAAVDVWRGTSPARRGPPSLLSA